MSASALGSSGSGFQSRDLIQLVMMSNLFNGNNASRTAADLFRQVGAYVLARSVDLPWHRYLPAAYAHLRSLLLGRSREGAETTPAAEPVEEPPSKSSTVCVRRQWVINKANAGTTAPAGPSDAGVLHTKSDGKANAHADALLWYIKKNTGALRAVDLIRSVEVPAEISPMGQIAPGITCSIALHSPDGCTREAIITLTSERLSVDSIMVFIEDCCKKHQAAVNSVLKDRLWVFDQSPHPGYRRRSPLFNMRPFDSTRSLDNVFLADGIERVLHERVRFFSERKDWYLTNGIPHTLGLLLWGPPGTGKTSTAKSIANSCGRHIFNVRLNLVHSSEALMSIFTEEDVDLTDGNTVTVPLDRRLYLLEDIDCMSDAVLRRDAKLLQRPMEDQAEEAGQLQHDQYKKPPLTLSDILNTLDGVVETSGRMMVLTSNMPDVLDEALLRPGRIDLRLQVGKMDQGALGRMVAAYCGPASTAEVAARDDAIFSACDNMMTPAEASSTLLSVGLKRKAALHELHQLSTKRRAVGN
jgi:hypothetical protein